MNKNPLFEITNSILTLAQSISRELGVLAGAKIAQGPVRLRKENRIKTIQASLAIEGNTLTLEQVSAILDGKRVLGPKSDIQEANNAIEVYKDLKKWDPLSINSIKRAHKLLMHGLVHDNGAWRKGGEGFLRGKLFLTWHLQRHAYSR